MSLMEAGHFTMRPARKCHICYGEIREDQDAVEHSGDGILTQSKDPRLGGLLQTRVEGSVNIWMHPECAVVLSMRLMHDVMKAKNTPDKPMRVVDTLQSVSKINQAR
jgi:hypothetical protein